MTKTETAKTETAESYFRVAESATGEPFLVCEPQGPKKIGALDGGFISFYFKQNVSLKDAETLAAELRRVISEVSITTFGGR